MAGLVVVYDDSMKAVGRTKTILGEKSFGDMVLKRQSMYQRMKQIVERHPNMKIQRVNVLDDFVPTEYAYDTIFFHVLSSASVLSADDLSVLLDKALFVKDNFKVRCGGKVVGGVFKNRESYEDFLIEYNNQNTIDCFSGEAIDTNALVDLTDYNALLMYVSNGFDARYFNSLQGDTYTVTKKSVDKKKIKAEYKYYWLLPESMKNWMVMPYDYKETDAWASYTMERMPMTDLAIRWTHSAVDEAEFKNILDKVFYFLEHRVQKEVTKEEYSENQDKLYLKKLDKRIEQLKGMPEYKKIAELIRVGTDFESIDEVVAWYKGLYKRIVRSNAKGRKVSVIGHGDLFFANMLYSKELNFLRFIDPKGALRTEELWMDPCYDIAKLSHSICGNYDFFNTGAYSIDFNGEMKFELVIHFDNTRAKEIFKGYLEENGYKYEMIRLFEASLFLSMLPLHIDNPHKVFGFILNAIMILKEVEHDL